MARHYGYRRVADFLAGLSPHELDYLRWSWTFDPPVEDRLDLILSRLEWRVAHLMAKAEDVTPFGEFRVRWDAVPPDDDAAEAAEANEVTNLKVVMALAGAQPGQRAPRPRGAVVDFKALGLVPD